MSTDNFKYLHFLTKFFLYAQIQQVVLCKIQHILYVDPYQKVKFVQKKNLFQKVNKNLYLK